MNEYVYMYKYFGSHERKILRNSYVEWNNGFIQLIFKYGSL